MIEKEIKLRVFTSQHELFMQMLMVLREKIGWDKDEKGGDNLFIVPFILTCSSALECSLNDYIISHFSSNNVNLNELTIGYLSMNLRGKLTNIVPLLTNGKYVINSNHKAYQTLIELIRIRNRLVHNKSSFEECKGIVITDESGEINIKIPDEVNQKLDDYSFGISRPIGRFQDALEDFYDKFFYIYKKNEVVKNDLILEIDDA